MNTIPIEQAVQNLFVYRNITKNPSMKMFVKLLKTIPPHPKKAQKIYMDLFHQLASEQSRFALQGDLWQNFVARLIWQDENFYTRIAEKKQPQFPSLSAWIQHDLPLLKTILFFDWKKFAALNHLPALPASTLETAPFSTINLMQKGIQELLLLFTEEKNQTLQQKLNAFYQQYGCGAFAGHLAFQWKKGLTPVMHPQLMRLNDLVGYEYQKSVLLKNTEAFVQGQKANHVLLYGEKGTGKSSSVKALLAEFADQGLRMVEITRQQFADFPSIIDCMKDRRFRFILFIDDLSFEASDSDFKYIKSCIEGSLENSPDNVLIYATSNRRHLIRENWSDRQGADEEVHISDTHQEKLSLSDRFGVLLSFYAPDKEQYLKIVHTLAQREGLTMDEASLREQAMQWEKMYHGYSGRSARQFVNFLCGQKREVK